MLAPAVSKRFGGLPERVRQEVGLRRLGKTIKVPPKSPVKGNTSRSQGKVHNIDILIYKIVK